MPFPVVKVGTEGLGKGIERLADLAKSAGVLIFGPAHTVRMAKAQAEALQIGAMAEIEVRTLEQRAAFRLFKEKVREQENLEAIYEEAAKYLPPESEVSAEPVSSDWTSKFNDRARFASEEEMRTLWAKLLASEVTRPGHISPRTIAIVDTMTPDEARALSAVLSCAMSSPGDEPPVMLLLRAGKGLDEEMDKSLFGVSYPTFENLRASGLIGSSDETIVMGQKDSKLPFVLRHGDQFFEVRVATGTVSLPIHLLTGPCCEIAEALRIAPNERFTERVIELLADTGYQVSSPTIRDIYLT